MQNLKFTPRKILWMFAIALSLAAMASTLRALAEDKPKPPEAEVAIVKDVKDLPKIDGVLDDAIWKDATELTVFKDPEGADVKTKTRVLLAHDDKNFYIAVECFEDAAKLKNLVADTTEHDGADIWQDDCVEFFIDPAGQRKNWYHLAINSKNISLDGYHTAGDDPRHGKMDWNPKFQSAVKVGDGSWTIEIAFPFDQFDRTATSSAQWSFNILRTRVIDGERQLIYWSPIKGASHSPDKFGVLKNMVEWKDRAVAK